MGLSKYREEYLYGGSYRVVPRSPGLAPKQTAFDEHSPVRWGSGLDMLSNTLDSINPVATNLIKQ